MDTRYFRKALEEYRARTGDNTSVYALPIRTLSDMLARAQELKTEEEQCKA